MDKTELAKSFRELDDLAREEYHESLTEVVSSEGDSDEMRLLRVGRLLGVALKEPFATSKVLDVPTRQSRAYRTWELKSEAEFSIPKARDSWQHQALEALRSDLEVVHTLGWQPSSVYELADTAQSERGFFWYLAMSCRNYLCRDGQIRDRINRQVEKAKSAGLDIKNVTPELIVASGGLAVGAALVQAVPVLGMLGAPVIAGIVFIVYSIGIDAFCQWAKDHETYHVDFPNADEEK